MKAELLAPNAAVTLGELVLVGIVSWLIVAGTRLVLRALVRAASGEGGLMTAERAEAVQAKISRLVRILAGLGALALVGYNGWLTGRAMTRGN